MRRMKGFFMKVAGLVVYSAAITTIISTSRHFAYQPQSDEAVMKKYRKKYLEK